jgi:hypothetical protein
MIKSAVFLFFSVAILPILSSIAEPISAHAQTVSTDFCYTFAQNLGEGRSISSADAQALTTALSSAGFWNANTSITSYNDAVASAVSGFQEKYASQILTPNGLSYGTGYVGASTRAELNALYGCNPASPTGTANQSFQGCPVGWICTPPTQSQAAYSCPTGWTCVPASGGSSTVMYSSIPASSATLSLDATTPIANTTSVTNIAAGTYLNLPILTFDVNAQGSTLHLHSLTVNLADAGPGNVTNAYLYQGSTLIASTQISDYATNIATFNNIPDNTPGASVAANTSVPFTVAVDVTGLANIANEVSVPVTVTASILPSDLNIYNATDNRATISGSATGNPVTVEGAGVRFSLPSVPTITKQVGFIGASGNSTATYTAAFDVQATTVDTSAILGLPNSSSPAISSTGYYPLVGVFENTTNINSAAEALSNFANASISYSQPANTTLSSDGASFTIAPNQVVMIPVTVSFTVNSI